LVQLRQQRDWQRQRRRLDGQPEPRLRRLRARRGGGRRVDLRAPPPPTIADLVAEVTEGGLPRGTERSLLAKLKGAQRKLDADHLNGACGSLGAYINEVRAQSGKKLEAAYAEDLIVEATAVRDAVGCGTS